MVISGQQAPYIPQTQLPHRPAAQILSVVYGQELPSPDASIGYQVCVKKKVQ